MDAEVKRFPNLQAAVDDTSLWLFFAALGGSGASLLALGLLLRSNQALTQRAVIGTLLHSLAWGAAVFLMTVDHNSLGLPFTLGVSIFSGMGVASFIDVIALVIKQKFGVTVTLGTPAQPPVSFPPVPAPAEPPPPNPQEMR